MPDQHRLNLTPHASQFLNSAVAMRRPNFLQQMAIQQQQLVHHLQLSQRQYMLQHGISLQPDITQTTHTSRGNYVDSVGFSFNLNPLSSEVRKSE